MLTLCPNCHHWGAHEQSQLFGTDVLLSQRDRAAEAALLEEIVFRNLVDAPKKAAQALLRPASRRLILTLGMYREFMAIIEHLEAVLPSTTAGENALIDRLRVMNGLFALYCDEEATHEGAVQNAA